MEDFNQDDMLYTVALLSKYYNKNTIEYLKSLIYLETSVFEDAEFNDMFKNLDSHLKIAYYNIINRSLLKIKEIDNVNFNKDNVYINTIFGNLNVCYKENDGDTYSLVSTSYPLGKDNNIKPQLSVFQIDTIKPGNKTHSLRTLSTVRRDLTNEVSKVLLEDWNIIFEESDKRLFSHDYVKSLSWIDVIKKTS